MRTILGLYKRRSEGAARAGSTGARGVIERRIRIWVTMGWLTFHKSLHL